MGTKTLLPRCGVHLCLIFMPVLMGRGAAVAGALHAQADAPVTQAVSGITAASVAQHLAALAQDSLADRDTPSRRL